MAQCSNFGYILHCGHAFGATIISLFIIPFDPLDYSEGKAVLGEGRINVSLFRCQEKKEAVIALAEGK